MCMSMLNKELCVIAGGLFKEGAIKFGEFLLKLHEKTPLAPPSPIYLNLRTPDNPKPGPLTPKLVRKMGKYLRYLSMINALEFDYIVGIPRAGEPFAEAFAIAYKKATGKTIPVLKLNKEELETRRKIGHMITGAFEPGKIVLVIDDLISEADSKFEAIEALEANGLVVKNVLVFVDREMGGGLELLRRGYVLHTAIGLSRLFSHYVNVGSITKQMRSEALTYPERLKQFHAKAT